MWDGTPAQLTNFANTTGATYPLLLLGTSPSTGSFQTWGPYDNHVVVSPDGIVRFNAVQQGYLHGNRYQKIRMRALIDSLLASTVGVGDEPPLPAFLRATPNPSSGVVTIELRRASAGVPARVTVHDLSGREIALLEGSGSTGAPDRFKWDGRDRRGRPVPAGVYLVRARTGEHTLICRVARLR